MKPHYPHHTFAVVACIIYLLLLHIPSASAEGVFVEYFHMEECPDCEKTDPLILKLETAYGGNVIVSWTSVDTTEGWEKWNTYSFLEVPAIVINNEIKIPKDEITEDNLRSVIAVYQAGGKPDNEFLSTEWSLPLAYSLGLFSGFSPCLMAVLGFILSFTASAGVWWWCTDTVYRNWSNWGVHFVRTGSLIQSVHKINQRCGACIVWYVGVN